jgi:uncharacterized protein YfiM (DUF2279 family)
VESTHKAGREEKGIGEDEKRKEKEVKMNYRVPLVSILTILFAIIPLLHSSENTSLTLFTSYTQPEKEKDEWFAFDKFFHVAASAGITGLSYHFYHCQFNNPYKNSVYFSLSVAGTAGIGKEFVDYKYRKTGWSWKDLAADAVGISLGYLLFIHLGKNK